MSDLMSSVTATPVQSASLTQALNGDQELGRDAFLRLLLTQLQYQDPMDPVKNEDFVAQLAQFSSLEQLQSINDNLSADEDKAATLGVWQAVESNTAVSLIGRDVDIPAEVFDYAGDGSVHLAYHLEGPAAQVTLQVFDSEGQLVRTLTEANPEAGNGSILWDGKDAEGQATPAGTYYVSPSAVNGQGDQVGASAVLTGQVIGVRYENGAPILVLEGGEAPLSAVTRISEGE